MKKYTKIFLAIFLSMQAYAMEKDSQNQRGEEPLHQRMLSLDLTTALKLFDCSIENLNETSKIWIDRLARCVHDLNYIKSFDSVANLGQYIDYLNKFIDDEKAYIHSLKQPKSAPHDADKIIALIEARITNAEEKKELAIAGTSKTTIQYLQAAHQQIIIKLRSLLLPQNSLHKIFFKGSSLYHLHDFNSKIQAAMAYIHNHLHSDSGIYRLLDMCPKGDYFHNISVLLLGVVTYLDSISKDIQTVSGEIRKIYNPLDERGRKLPSMNEAKRDS